MTDVLRATERQTSPAALSLCAAPGEALAGVPLVPDVSKGFVLFTLSHAFPAITAYRTAVHPAVVAASWPSLHLQLLDLGHEVQSYAAPAERARARDNSLGTVVAVEFPDTPAGGWTLGSAADGASAPAIRGAAVIHKQLAGAAEVLATPERWTVSQEITYALAESGFLILQRERLTGANAALCAQHTPAEADALGMGYVPWTEAPTELLATYNPATRMAGGRWGGSTTLLLKGGFTGRLHFMGVGLVRYGAEAEAAVERFLAAHPLDPAAFAAGCRALAAASDWQKIFAKKD